MKKIIIFFVAILPIIVNAQQLDSKRETINLQSQDYVQEVRSYEKGYYVVLSKNNRNFTFTIINDQLNIARTVDIPSSYFVNDFEIFGDNVYFCGNGSEGIGFIGNFTVYDLLISSISINTVYISGTSNIDKIKVYYDPEFDISQNIIHIVGIGEMNASSYYPYCFVDCSNRNNYPNWDYTIDASTYKMTDIAVTEDYVITISYISLNNIGVRRHNKSYPNDISLMNHVKYDLGLTIPGLQTPIDGKFFAESFPGNKVAVASSSLIENDYATVVNYFVFLNDTISMLYTGQYIPNGTTDYARIREMRFFNDDSGHFVLLEKIFSPIYFGYDADVFFNLDILPMNSYYAPMTYLNDMPYLNSFIQDKPYNYIATGVETQENNLTLFRKDIRYQSSTSCNKQKSVGMIKTDYVNKQVINTYINPYYESSFVWNSMIRSTYANTLTVECYNYNEQ